MKSGAIGYPVLTPIVISGGFLKIAEVSSGRLGATEAHQGVAFAAQRRIAPNPPFSRMKRAISSTLWPLFRLEKMNGRVTRIRRASASMI